MARQTAIWVRFAPWAVSRIPELTRDLSALAPPGPEWQPEWQIADVLELLRRSTQVSIAEQQLCGRDTARLVALHLVLQVLTQRGVLELATGPDRSLLLLRPMTPEFALSLAGVDREAVYRLSRFAYIRRDDAGDVLLETPRSLAKTVLQAREAATLVHALATGASIADLAASSAAGDRGDQIAAAVELLAMAMVIEPVERDGTSFEDRNTALRQWEFHDLVFHTRSRMGRHDHPMGGIFRFQGTLPPQPAVKAHAWGTGAIPLPHPDLDEVMRHDPPFSAVLEARRSVRGHGVVPLSAAQLGEFLFRVGRIRGATQTAIGQFTNRVYPSGGASYELELYLAVDRCLDLARGFYYYDPLAHAICAVASPDHQMELMLHDAYESSARNCRPQVLIIVASRFQRVSWKYSGIAYATQLKNLGALISVMYLVATAMGLAPCALGLGNSERFCQLSGMSPFEEASIGEFMLGTRAGA